MIPTIRLTCRSVLLISPLVSWVCHERHGGLLLCHRGDYRSDREQQQVLFGSVLATASPSPAATVMERLVDLFPDYALPSENSASSDISTDISLLATTTTTTTDGDEEIIIQSDRLEGIEIGTFFLFSSGSNLGNIVDSWEDYSLGNAFEHAIAL